MMGYAAMQSLPGIAPQLLYSDLQLDSFLPVCLTRSEHCSSSRGVIGSMYRLPDKIQYSVLKQFSWIHRSIRRINAICCWFVQTDHPRKWFIETRQTQHREIYGWKLWGGSESAVFSPRLLQCTVSPERKEDLETSSSFPNWRLISFWIAGWEGDVRWCGWMKTENWETIYYQERESDRAEKRGARWCEWLLVNVQKEKPLYCFLGPAWLNLLKHKVW